MIKKTIISAFIFLLLYAIFVMVRPLGTSQHQWQDNIIKAQRFIYADDVPQSVIVGSSLSCRLVMDNLPQMYNLSFQALTIYDGLPVLVHKEKLPKNVFIEMNVALRKESNNFSSTLNNPILYNVRKRFLFLRDEYQPMGVLGSASIRFVNKVMSELRSISPNKATSDAQNFKKNEGLFLKLLNAQIESYSKKPEQKLLDERFNNLAGYVAELGKKGVQVIFFEMPVNGKLCDLPKARIIRETFYKDFPPAKYRYISMPACSEYETTDGVHLGHEEAERYTAYFRAQAGKYLH